MITTIENFFLDAWIWSMTWGIYHMPINMLVMILCFIFVARLRIIPSIWLTVFSKLFSIVLYALVVLCIVYFVKLQIVFPETVHYQNINTLAACISLAVIYSFFQVLFFLIVNRFYALNIGFIAMITVVSNFISALLVYKFIDIP